MSASSKRKPLRVATSVGELNGHVENFKAKIVINNQMDCKRYCEAIHDMHRRAEAQLTDGDEENAYVLYMRYLHIFGIIRRSYEYNKKSKYYLEILSGTPTKAIKAAEQLASSLEKRYADLAKDSSQPEPTQAKKPVTNPGPAPKKNIRSNSDSNDTGKGGLDNKTVSGANGVHVNDDNIDDLLPSIPNEVEVKQEPPKPAPPTAKNTVLSVFDFYHILNKADLSQLLIFDVRPAAEFAQSKIKIGVCVNIPSDLLKPGATVNSIERRLPKDVWEVWIQRGQKEQIVIMDSHTEAKDMTINNPARILKDAIFLWGSGTPLKNEPLILDGGFQNWIVHFPSLTTNAFYSAKKSPHASQSDIVLPTLDYPELPTYEEPKVQDEIDKPSTAQMGNGTINGGKPDRTEVPPNSSLSPVPSTGDADSQLSRSHINNKLEEMRRLLEERDKARDATRRDFKDQPSDENERSSLQNEELPHQSGTVDSLGRGKRAKQETGSDSATQDGGNLNDGGVYAQGKNTARQPVSTESVPPYSPDGSGSGITSSSEAQRERSTLSNKVTVPSQVNGSGVSSYPNGRSVISESNGPALTDSHNEHAKGVENAPGNHPVEWKGHPTLPSVAWAGPEATPVGSVPCISPQLAGIGERTGFSEQPRNGPLIAQQTDYSQQYKVLPQSPPRGTVSQPLPISNQAQVLPQGQPSSQAPSMHPSHTRTPIPSPRQAPAHHQHQRPTPTPRKPQDYVSDSAVPFHPASTPVPNPMLATTVLPTSQPPYSGHQPSTTSVPAATQPLPPQGVASSFQHSLTRPMPPASTPQVTPSSGMNYPISTSATMTSMPMQAGGPGIPMQGPLAIMKIPASVASSNVPTTRPTFSNGNIPQAVSQPPPASLQLPMTPGQVMRPNYIQEGPSAGQPRSLPFGGQPRSVTPNARPSVTVPDSPGLPKGWEKCIDGRTGRVYYKDHVAQSTHWELPPDFCASLKHRPETKTPERAATVKPAAGGLSQKAKLKRSLSSPNLADLEESEKADAVTPKINRDVKPKQLIDRSTKPMSASRLQNLSPVYGSKGQLLTGLRNLGNTCFMNAVIQCLANTSPLARYLSDGHFTEDLNPNSVNRRPGEITKELAFLIKVLSSGQYRSVSPVDLKASVGRFATQFAGTSQQDAHEFLMFFLDGLHEDVNKVQCRIQMKEQDNDNIPDAVAAEKAWGEYKRRNDSIVVDLFQGQFRSTVTCLACNKKSVTFDAFNCLPLQLTSRNSCNLEDCIRSFVRPERIGGNNSWKCSQCKTYREATKTIEIWKLPPILIIQLKRFSSDGMWHNKLQTTVHFPAGDFDMRKHITGKSAYEQFKLYGVVNHYGSFECGHYTAFCENAHVGKWFCYDDNAVKDIDRSSVKTSAAYLLFYTAVDLRAYLAR